MRVLLIALLAAISYAQTVTCRMTIDNSVSHVRYGGVDLSVSGNLGDWDNVKTFSYTPVYGYELEIGGWEHSNCHGCSCSGLLLECDDGFVSDTDNWVAWGGSSQSVSPSSGYSTPCQSSSGFHMSQAYSRAMTKIWASNGDKYAWFKATPYEGDSCPEVVHAGSNTPWLYPQQMTVSSICASAGHGSFIRYACGSNADDVSTPNWGSIQYGPYTTDDLLQNGGQCNCCCNCNNVYICCEESQEGTFHDSNRIAH